MSNRATMQLLDVLVHHRPGVLYRISNLFRRRGFNITSVAVGIGEKDNVARLTLGMRGERADAEQLVKYLENLVDVISAEIIDRDTAVTRELALIKLQPDPRARLEIIQLANVFRSSIVHMSDESIIIETVGDSEKIDAFIELARRYGLKEVSRTGTTALPRGSGTESEDKNHVSL
ncbi:MAG: acetolactate synthase small subunit [archaeon]